MIAGKALTARRFANLVHKNQQRKYTNAPYVTHLAEVAGIVASVAPRDMFDTMVSVAWLHDCVEDQGVEKDYLVRVFGREIADGVMWLSDLETGNRAERKAASRDRLAQAPWWVQTIKCADLISNTSSISQYDPKFAVTYLAEKRALLAVLNNADSHLLMDAVELAGNPTPEELRTDGYGTLRGWACYGTGDIQPQRVNGRLAWPVADIRKLLGVAA